MDAQLKLRDQAGLLWHILRWRLNWRRHDSTLLPDGLGPLFRSAADAVTLIEDGATVLSSGLAANARCSIFFWAVRERFLAEQRPRGLTWLSVGAQGGRGRVPGTVDELALPGLVTRYISGHLETAKAMLALADAGELELHTLPQGEMTRLIDGQVRGSETLLSDTGVGTFLDPRCGTGSLLCPRGVAGLVEAAGHMLRYRLPRIDVAMCNAPWADRQGNIYFHDAATLTEALEGARAARHNNGKVLVCVADLIERDAPRIGLRSDEVDAIVVNPHNEQTGSVPQRRFFPAFTPTGGADEVREAARLRFVNRVLGITPRRTAADDALARLAARIFAARVPRGAIVNIGVGHPEDVCRVLYRSCLRSDITFTTETGVYGGLPAPGIFFGAAINPLRLETSAWMFRYYLKHLDAAVLGMLEMDENGDVNVSRRGTRAVDYVGPGGFPSIVAGARTVIFVGGWMTRGRYSVSDGRLRIERSGPLKLVKRVREVTFSARQALARGKRVYYVTHVGVFELTPGGLTLIQVMPGIDVAGDICAATEARIRLAAGGPDIVHESVLSGRDFELDWAAFANDARSAAAI